jgi:hypothetical protein
LIQIYQPVDKVPQGTGLQVKRGIVEEKRVAGMEKINEALYNRLNDPDVCFCGEPTEYPGAVFCGMSENSNESIEKRGQFLCCGGA